jgi:hypothetical protein
MDGFVENPNLKWMIETWVPPFQETAIVWKRLGDNRNWSAKKYLIEIVALKGSRELFDPYRPYPC